MSGVGVKSLGVKAEALLFFDSSFTLLGFTVASVSTNDCLIVIGRLKVVFGESLGDLKELY